MNRRRFLGAFLGAIAGVSFLRADTIVTVLTPQQEYELFIKPISDAFFRPSPLLAYMRKTNKGKPYDQRRINQTTRS